MAKKIRNLPSGGAAQAGDVFVANRANVTYSVTVGAAAGEVVSSTVLQASAVSLTSTTAANITSISLTAGTWRVSGSVLFLPDAATNVTYVQGGISSTTGTLPATASQGIIALGAGAGFVTGNVPFGGAIPSVVLVLGSTTTIYLVGRATFTVSTLTCFGAIDAVRIV